MNRIMFFAGTEAQNDKRNKRIDNQKICFFCPLYPRHTRLNCNFGLCRNYASSPSICFMRMSSRRVALFLKPSKLRLPNSMGAPAAGIVPVLCSR